MGTGVLCRVHPTAVHLGRASNVQGRDRVGIVEGSYGYRARGVCIRGKFVLSRNPGVQDEGGRHVTKRSSDPRVA